MSERHSALHASGKAEPIVKSEAVNRRLAVDAEENEEPPSCCSRFASCFCNHKGFWLMFGVLMKLSFADLKARKGAYCLCFFAVFVVVVLSVLMFSSLSNLPIVFLRLAEDTEGQTDLIIRPGGQFAAASSINYSLVEEVFPLNDELRGYHAPRISWRTTIVNFKACSNATGISSLWYLPSGLPCWEDCLKHHCQAANLQYPVIAIDQYRESRMGLADDWKVPLLKEGEIILSRNAAFAINGTVVGDTVVLYGVVDTVFGDMLSNVPVLQSKPTVMMAMKVVAIVDSEPLKFTSRDFIVMDFNSTTSTVAKSLSPYISQDEIKELSQFDPRWCVSAVYFNMNSKLRLDCYRNSEFDGIQHTLLKWASSIIEPLGFNQVEAHAPILKFLRKAKFFTLFMGLIISAVLGVMGILSFILIYSLLNVGVSTRSYELGIHRLLGFTKRRLALMVLFNAYMFAIPAWITGLVVGQLLFLIVRHFVSEVIGAQLPALVPLSSIGWATVAGLLLPLFGSIIPIISVVLQKLPEVLDANHGGNSGVVYKINRAKDRSELNLIVFGLGFSFAFFGFLLYYLFPIGLFNMNLSLLLYIFFSVLFGMLGGLVLLALNFEHALHVVVANICFFWENQAVLLVVKKNLSSHKLRNRKTTFMYALALSCIIFITIAFQTQLTSFKYNNRREFGAEVLAIVSIDLIELGGLASYVNTFLKDKVTGLTYVSHDTPDYTGMGYISMMTLGRFVESYVDNLLGVPPNFFEVLGDEFLKVDEHHPLTEQYGLGGSLYVEGEHRVIVSTASYKKMRLQSLDDSLLFTASRNTWESWDGPQNVRLPIKATSALSSAPVVIMSRFLGINSDIVTSSSTAMRLTGIDYMSIRGVPIRLVVFRVPNERDIMHVTRSVSHYVSTRFAGGYVRDIKTALSQFNTADRILTFFFMVTQFAILVICSFSLFSSMTANVMESSKEIGVFRCIGMSKFQIYRAFTWESFSVVIVAGILGLTVGIVVGYTLQIQNALFTQLTVPFYFPYIQALMVVVIALVASVFSSYVPVAFLLNQPSITRILRRTS